MKLGIAGIKGRMGQAICDEALRHAQVGRVVGSIRAGEDMPPACDKVRITKDAEDLFVADVVVDFTRPNHLMELADYAAQYGKALVSGTTGLSKSQHAKLAECAKKVPIVWAPNMSICVTLLMQLTQQVAGLLDDEYDIEIVEMHHRNKVDAPSGTALGMGRAAALGRGVEFDEQKVLSREGETGPRKQGTIGFATMRGGQVIGDHTAIFAGEYERLELTHKSSDRRIYAQGAVTAARWAVDQPAGLYDMRDVLGLKV